MGGVLVWGTLSIVILIPWVLDRILHIGSFHQFNFMTRRETLLPLGALLGASFVGLVDDWMDVRRLGIDGRGLRFRFKIWLYVLVAVIGAWWFYHKLGFDSLHFPFYGPIHLGWLFIPFFILTVIATSFAVNETDGLDGLSGGILMISFFCFGLIAFLQGRYNLASFIGVICGSLLAFLWFNVYPARFIMGDTGSMGLGVLLAVVAFLTNSVFLLPVIGFVFVVEALSFLLQLFWKRVFKKKLFKIAPLHHHFEACGWPETKVTMRFWIISAVTGIIGVIIYFLG
jgi:phospho-N-acetylmuramoyl-pentapeptide-transferase